VVKEGLTDKVTLVKISKKVRKQATEIVGGRASEIERTTNSRALKWQHK
jgi:hypothetical protein